MHAVYGFPPPDLAPVLPDAMQVSPLVAGAGSLEAMADASLDSVTMLAARGNLERRFAIAHALRASKPGAALIVLALKNQGGNRIAGELASFGCAVTETSRRHHRICAVVRPAAMTGIDAAIAEGAPRLVETLGLWSQPGIFSWDRIDPGSAMLMDYLPKLAGRGADLGCGIGVLTRAVLLQDSVVHVTAIDIDRRAVEAARRNADAKRASFLWADVRATAPLPGDLDFVVMNPPFHDGGAEDQDLGRTFIKRASAMLRPGGICAVVANRHLPYEGVINPLFAEVSRPIQADGFKVYVARK
jgi:16S rRNA (guanine1207-N2)-methyltransferase